MISVEFDHSPEKQTERFHHVRTWIPRLFPRTVDTPVTGLVENLLDEIAPLCDQISGRGSWSLRTELCPDRPYAPAGYWKLPEEFQWFAIKSRDNDNTEMVQAVIEHNAEGPDADLMIKKRDGITDTDILEKIREWIAVHTGLKHKRGVYDMSVKPVVFSDWNGTEDPRVYSSVLFTKRHKGWGDPDWHEPLLRVDIGEMPNIFLQSLDARLSAHMTFKDILSLTELKRWERGWIYSMDPEYQYPLNHMPNGVMMSGGSAPIKMTVGSRYVLQEIFYSTERIGNWLSRQLRMIEYDYTCTSSII